MIRILRCSCLVALALFSGERADAADSDLAQRFRPFIKTSLDGLSAPEQFRPIRWQDFVANSDLVLKRNGGIQTLVRAADWDKPQFLKLLTSGSNLVVHPGSVPLELHRNTSLPAAADEESRHGADWSRVALGDGIYAQVQHLGQGKDDLVNINYNILWVLNEGRAHTNYHYGDLTFLVVLYDPKSDNIVRVSFPAHGCILQTYELVPHQTVSIGSLSGQDLSGHAQGVLAAKVEIAGENANHDDRGACSQGGAVGFSANHVFLVADSDALDHRFEHPALFVENGTHESWPNETGRVTDGGDHAGKGPSWLPAAVTLLPAFDEPDGTVLSGFTAPPAKIDPNIAFVHFNGKIGEDGQNVVLHRTWCWPAEANSDYRPCAHNNVGIPDEADGASDNRFVDMQPYEPKGNLNWPQAVNWPSSDFYAVPDRQAGDGSIQHPFGGLDVAQSFATGKSTLHLQGGAYPPVKLDKPMTVVAWNGAVTIGK
jgi:hypothetical protein